MRQVAHERPFFHPGRVLHIRKPGLTTFVGGRPEFGRPGLLGVAPGMHIVPRPPPRHVHYPLHGHPHLDAIPWQQEHVLPPEPVPLHPHLEAQHFLQMAWVKGVQREKRMNHIRNRSAWKYGNAAKLKTGPSKVAKKGISLGNTEGGKHNEEDSRINKKKEVALKEPSSADKEPKEQHAGASSPNEQSSTEAEHMGEQIDEKTYIEEDLEEGEIGAGSPEHHINVDVYEDSKQIDSATAASDKGVTSHLNSVLESVDSAECEIAPEQIVNIVSEEDLHQLAKATHTSEKEIVNSTTNSVSTEELQNIGVPSVDMNDTLLNTSSAEVLVQNSKNISTCDALANHDCQLVDIDRDGPCLDYLISPFMQELLVFTEPESVGFDDSNVDAGDSIEAVTKPKEEFSISPMACEAAVGISSILSLQRPVETCSNKVRENLVQTQSSSTVLEVGPKLQEEFPASITMEQILATLRCFLSESTCLNLADKAGAGVMEAGNIAQFLSEISGILESFEKRDSCPKSRDPRRNLRAISFGESESCSKQEALAKERAAEKRKHERQEDVLETPAKRLCTEVGIASHLELDNRLSPEVLHQEPIDMEIDSSDSSTFTSVETCVEVTSESNNDQDDDTKPCGSRHPSVIHAVKPRLRSRDPRRTLVDRGKAKIGYMCAGETQSQSETTPCVPDGRSVLLQSSKPLSLSEGVGTLKDIHFEGLTDQQLQAVYTERARRIGEQNQMLNSKKLCLVLDLDHTLLNSAKFSEVEKFKVVLREMEAADRRCVDSRSVKRDLYWYPKLGMWTKLRPGVWDFLSRASQLYELHVYTMGNKAYATEMAKLLDPTGALFAGRVISRGDDSERTFNTDALPKSKDLDGVLGLESAVIIIDDSAQVWPHHRHNLLLVERYMYFPSSRRQFGLSGPSLLEIKHDERATDGMLASVLKVIEKVHDSFFANPRLHEADVRSILATEKQSILAGCKIVFSRVFPQGELQPHLHPLWQIAEQFGAVCTTNIDDEVTHVVAISRGTDKVKWAMRTGRFSVCPGWLEASAVLYRRANESDFPVPP